MNKKFFVLIILLWVFLSSCSQTSTPDNYVIDVVNAFNNQKPIHASDCFTKVRYVPLETTDECVIGRGVNVQIVDDMIMVTTTQNQCFLFDKETGRYLTTVGHYGEDPEGYKTSSGQINRLTETICMNSWNDSWVTYDYEGNFKGKINLPKGVSLQSSFVPLDPKTWVVHSMDFFSDGIESIRYIENDSIRKTIVLHEQDGNYNVNNINSISVLKGEYGQEVFGSGAVMVVHFKDAPEKAYVGMVGLNRLWSVDNEIYFKGDYNDTIYRIKNHELQPAYIFHLGEYQWSYEKRFDTDHDHALLVAQILDSKDFMLFRFVHRLFTDEKRKSYNAVYDKKSGELKISPIDEGIKDDLTHFMPFRPYSVSPYGEYTGYIQAYDVVEWFENYTGDITRLPDEIQLLRSVQDEDNPVVVILE